MTDNLDAHPPHTPFTEQRKEYMNTEIRGALPRQEAAGNLFHLATVTDRMLHSVNASIDSDEMRDVFMRIKAEGDSVQPDDTDTHTRDQIEKYLRNKHGYFFHVADQIPHAQAPAGDHASQQEISFSRDPEFTNKVVDSVISYVQHSRSVSTFTPPQWQAMRQILSGITSSSSAEYAEFQAIIDGSTNPTHELLKALDQRTAQALLVEADPNKAGFAARDWRREQHRRKSNGEKVMETESVRRIMDRCDIIGDKENGIGGKIFYGPPGTGKTELAIHHAQRNGFKTRVVSMHYWQTFNSLVYEASLKVTGAEDKTLSFMNRMTMAVDAYEAMDDAQFEQTMNDMLGVLKANGKVAEGATVADYVRPFLIEGESDTDKSLRKGVIRGMRARAAAAGFGEQVTQDNFWDEIVKGEILLALEQGQDRVILDEIEKAGPTSYDGLSRILAMSGGTELDVRGAKIKVPKTFKIDATANSMDMNEFMRSRFNSIFIDYPPAKDEVAIMSVKLSDSQGNVLLTQDEQHRMVAFFTYTLPEIRQLWRDQVISQPFDLRVTNELCNLLVDPTSGQRTGVSLESALRMVLLEQRSFTEPMTRDSSGSATGKDELDQKRATAKTKLNQILEKYGLIIREPAPVVGEEEERLLRVSDRMLALSTPSNPADSAVATARREARVETLGNAYQATIDSPFAVAVRNLTTAASLKPSDGRPVITEQNHLRPVDLQHVEIDASSVAAYQTSMQEKNDRQKGTKKSTQAATGLTVVLSGQQLKYVANNADGSSQVYYQKTLEGSASDASIIDTSVDGRFVLIKQTNGAGEPSFELVDSFATVDNKNEAWKRDIKPDSHVNILANGQAILAHNTNDQQLSISLAVGEPLPSIEAAGYQVNQAQSAILIERPDGTTWYVDVQQLFQRNPTTTTDIQPTAILRGNGWQFIGDKLLSQGSNLEKAVLVSPLSRPTGKESI